jgi:hypothetical protein
VPGWCSPCLRSGRARTRSRTGAQAASRPARPSVSKPHRRSVSTQRLGRGVLRRSRTDTLAPGVFRRIRASSGTGTAGSGRSFARMGVS